MNFRNTMLSATAVILLSSSPVWAKSEKTHHEDSGIRHTIKALALGLSQSASAAAKAGGSHSAPIGVPEIDAAAGTGSIALLSGLLMLLREKRKNRSVT